MYACCTIKPNLKCISLKTCDTFGVFFSFQKLLQRYDHRLKCWNQDSSLYFGSVLNSSVIHWMECTSVIEDYAGNDSILKTEHCGRSEWISQMFYWILNWNRIDEPIHLLPRAQLDPADKVCVTMAGEPASFTKELQRREHLGGKSVGRKCFWDYTRLICDLKPPTNAHKLQPKHLMIYRT